MNAVAAMLLEPLSAVARMAAGLAFEAEGLNRCAIEQFMAAADLADHPVPALLCAARILAREGSVDQASEVAERVLALDPASREAANLVFGSNSPPAEGGAERKTWMGNRHQ